MLDVDDLQIIWLRSLYSCKNAEQLHIDLLQTTKSYSQIGVFRVTYHISRAIEDFLKINRWSRITDDKLHFTATNCSLWLQVNKLLIKGLILFEQKTLKLILILSWTTSKSSKIIWKGMEYPRENNNLKIVKISEPCLNKVEILNTTTHTSNHILHIRFATLQ